MNRSDQKPNAPLTGVPEAPAPRSKEIIRIRFGGLFALAAILLLALAGTGCDRDAAEEEVAAISAPETDMIIAFGTVVASDQLEIRLPWDCRLASIPVWEGQRVDGGDVLAYLEAGDVEAAMEKARLSALAARVSMQEAVGRLASLEVTLAEAGNRLDRLRRLVDGGSVSAQELAAVQAEFEALSYERDSASWALDAQRGDSDLADGEYARLRERVSQPPFDGARLICPFDTGLIVEIQVRPGAFVEAGEIVMVLHDAASPIVEADLPEEFVRDVRPGSSAAVVPVADPERSYAGRVEALAGLARLENGENVVKMRVALVGTTDGFLREGFNVDVKIGVNP